MSLPIIAVYAGRFQPMGMHHKMTYDWMVQTFGYDNSFIVSSDKVKLPKSPLTFDEKKSVALAHGVPDDKFVYARSPYVPTELFEKIAIERGLYVEDLSVVFIVGKKDMEDNPRFRVGYKKSGGPSYFQTYNQNAQLLDAKTHGYLAVAPHVVCLLPNCAESSGTALRIFLSNSTEEDFREAMGFYDSNIDAMFKSKFTNNVNIPALLKEATEIKERIALEMGTNEYNDYIDNLILDIKHVKKSLNSRTRKNERYRKESSRLQSAIETLRHLLRKNQRKLLANNSINETTINYITYEESNKINNNDNDHLTRDEIKSFFNRLK